MNHKDHEGHKELEDKSKRMFYRGPPGGYEVAVWGESNMVEEVNLAKKELGIG